MRCLSILAVLSFAIAFSHGRADAKTGEWQYIATDGGVVVYKKEIEGSDVVAFKGIAYANVPIAKLLAVFKEPTERPHWVDRYAEHKTLEKDTDTETYWIHFGLPWPVSDRDYILNAVGTSNEATRTYTAQIKSVDHKDKGEDDCCVRAQVYGTYYEFQALPGEPKTKLTVEVHTDPKGSIPTWLVNLIQKSWPSKTLVGLIKRAKEAPLAPLSQYSTWHDAKEQTSTTPLSAQP